MIFCSFFGEDNFFGHMKLNVEIKANKSKKYCLALYDGTRLVLIIANRDLKGLIFLGEICPKIQFFGEDTFGLNST